MQFGVAGCAVEFVSGVADGNRNATNLVFAEFLKERTGAANAIIDLRVGLAVMNLATADAVECNSRRIENRRARVLIEG